MLNSPRSDLTLVVLILAFLAMEIGNAIADRLTFFHETERAVFAWRVVAHFDVLLAVGTCESHGTNASIRCHLIDANSSVHAGRALAFVYLDAAEASLPTRRTFASEVESSAFHALATVMTFVSTS